MDTTSVTFCHPLLQSRVTSNYEGNFYVRKLTQFHVVYQLYSKELPGTQKEKKINTLKDKCPLTD